jgi:hypothetical protein
MDVDKLNAELRELVLERQALRERGAAADELERNRVSIVRVQWQLSHALIQAHVPRAA